MTDTKTKAPRQRVPRGPGGGPMRLGGEKPKNFKKTMKTLLTYLKPYLPALFVVVIFAVGSSAFNIFGPRILGQGINQVAADVIAKLEGRAEGINFTALGKIVLNLIAVYVLSLGLAIVQNFVVTGIAQKISYKFRKDLMRKINLLPLGYYDSHSHGDVMSRVTNDVDTISQTLNQSLSQIITSVTVVIGVFIMMLTISPSMTLVAVLIIPASLLFVTRIIGISQKFFKTQQSALGKVNGHVEENFSGYIVVKAFGAEDKTTSRFNEINDELFNSAWKSQFLSGIMMPVMGFIGNLGYVLVCVMGGVLTIRGRINIGDITSFTNYVRMFTQPLSQIAQISNLLQSTAAAAERVFEFLDEPTEKEDTKNPVSTKNIEGNVTFKNVNFGYKPDVSIINNFSADIKKGQKIAIVGPTGAGKTTIVKLLMRFYDVNKGEILIDGHNIKDFKRNELRDLFSMVLQETWLFNGSIMDNIRYGNLEADKEEVKNAAKAANVDHFIKTLPGGYDMVLNEEATNISGGQKQLLTIARAILSDPQILILDEATSSVDTRTEILIQKAMANLMEGRTSFIIAHRLSTIRDADIILVMNDGDIIEQGSHEQLIAKKGFYHDLYNSQFDNNQPA